MRLISKIFILVLFFASPAFAADSIGKVAEVSGKVVVSHEKGKKNAVLALNDPLFLKDVVETKKEGAVKITFIDKSSLVLRENSKIVISTFLFNPKQGERQTGIDVAYGKVRAIIEKFYNKSKSKTELKAPTAVVGVRGTEFAMDVTKKKATVYCLKGSVATYNPMYPTQAVDVAAGKFTDVIANKIPELPIPIPKEVLDTIESQFGFPTSVESLKQRGLDNLKGRLPFP